jgi:hypothetical protein
MQRSLPLICSDQNNKTATQNLFGRKTQKNIFYVYPEPKQGDLLVGHRISGRWTWDWFSTSSWIGCHYFPLLLFALLHEDRVFVNPLSHPPILNFQKFSLRFPIREAFEVEVLSTVLQQPKS